jgi:hypothetical protein
VDPADRSRARGDEVVVSLRQQPQHRSVVLEADLSQPRVAEGDDGSRAGIVAVGLVTVVVVQQPHTGSKLRWHVDHLLAGGDELLGEQRPGPGGALNGPQPRHEPVRPVQQTLSLLSVSRQVQHRPHLLITIQHRGNV